MADSALPARSEVDPQIKDLRATLEAAESRATSVENQLTDCQAQLAEATKTRDDAVAEIIRLRGIIYNTLNNMRIQAAGLEDLLTNPNASGTL